ncbi:MAG: metallophosphoesterase [Lachnospiraceae bacterium]|jgi:Icc-related predicted phosphoesterase|nr:metallophosphoesterase [Lachnospiraceae bacterium]MCX4347902.1 metallophosphoesterase [Lachnospiraceae bacterium]
MRILAIADEESKALWDYFDKSMLEGIDLIISCGDLDPRYLSFLVTFYSGPVLYVHGNHDGKYEQIPPEGCTCIEDKIFVYKGVRILGLGGSMRYKPGPHQYTEYEMKQRVARLWFKLFKKRGFDILVTHAPAYQLNDGRDLPHQGFKIFRKLMEKYRPKFFLHGHVHLSYGRDYKRYDRYEDTHIINAYERCIFDFEDDEPQEHLIVHGK